MKHFILSAFIGLALLTACSKDRKTAQEIEGTWLEVKIDGVDVPSGFQDQLTFGACKNRKKKYCDFTLTDSYGYSYSMNYKIKDKGKTLSLELLGGFLSISEYHTIVELEGDHMVIDWADYVGTYARQ